MEEDASYNPNRGRAVSSPFPAPARLEARGHWVNFVQEIRSQAARAASLPEAESAPRAETYLLTEPWPCPRLQSEQGTLQPALETGSSALPRELDTSWGNGDPNLLGSRARRGRCAQI